MILQMRRCSREVMQRESKPCNFVLTKHHIICSFSLCETFPRHSCTVTAESNTFQATLNSIQRYSLTSRGRWDCAAGGRVQSKATMRTKVDQADQADDQICKSSKGGLLLASLPEAPLCRWYVIGQGSRAGEELS